MKRLLLFFGIILATVSAYADPSSCWIKHDGGCEANVGKRLWVSIPTGIPTVVEVTFTKNDWTTARTLQLKRGASFVVIGLEKGSMSDDYRVRLDDGRVGWMRATTKYLADYDPVARAEADREESAARAKATREDCARRGQPKIGMTQAELIETCWRLPTRVVKKTTAAGIEEIYIYGTDHTVKFTDGKASEIVETH